jgi:hypothetical protein
MKNAPAALYSLIFILIGVGVMALPIWIHTPSVAADLSKTGGLLVGAGLLAYQQADKPQQQQSPTTPAK